MKSAYNEKLMLKYGIDESDAETINELKRRIRKASPLAKDQKDHCEVCNTSSKDEPIYNHHIMKVEYLAVLAYYYDLYKKEKNPNYVENRGNTPEEINTQSEREYIYVLKKDLDLYIPRVAICERHHNMIHELANDYEGSTNKGLIKKAKPKELKSLYEIFADSDLDIYQHIFGENESLEGREYYVSYLKIWNDTMEVAMTNIIEQIDRRLENQYDELGKKNIMLLTDLKDKAEFQRNAASEALEDLNAKFITLGEENIEMNIEEFEQDEITDESALEIMKVDELENIYHLIASQENENIEDEKQEQVDDEEINIEDLLQA